MSKFIDSKDSAKATYPLHTRIAAGAMGTLLGITMTIPFGATAALADDASSDDAKTEEAGKSATAKNEVVYTKTDANGKASGIYVVNGFNTSSKTEISDPGTYESVTNLSTSEKLSCDDGTTEITTTANEPFYYQGNLSADTELPWNVEITYTLDGKEVSPEELAGATGKLDLELKVTGLSDDSASADFAKSFVVQAQGTFDNDTFKLDKAKDATVATVGNQTLLTYLILPGSDGDYHITGDVQDFSYSGWQISCMPLELAIDLDDYDTSQLTDAVGELESGTAQLADGGTELLDGLSTLDSGAQSASSGAAQLANGAWQIANGTQQATDAIPTLTSGTEQISAGTSKLAAGLSTLQSTGTSELAGGTSSLVAVLDAKDTELQTLKAGAEQVAVGTDNLVNALSSLPTLINETQTGLTGLQTQLDAIKTDTTTLKTKSANLTSLGTKAATNAAAVSGDLQNISNNIGDLSTQLSTTQTNITSASGNTGQASSSASLAKSNAENAVVALDAMDTSGLTDAQIAAIQNARRAAAEAVYYADVANTKSLAASNNLKDANASVQAAITDVSNIGTYTQSYATDAANLTANLTDLSNGLSDLTTFSDSLLVKSQAAIDDGQTLITNTNSKLSGLSDDLAQAVKLKTGAASVSEGVTSLVDSMEPGGSLYDSATKLAAGAAAVDENTQLAATNAQTIADGAVAINDGVGTLVNGTYTLNVGAHTLATSMDTLNSGLSTLASGTSSAASGAQTLADGLDTLASSVDGMDTKILDELQNTVDEKLGKGYELHSFVDPSNTDVNEVEFVYVVSGVSEADSDTTEAEDEAEDAADDQSFIERLTSLFDFDN